MNFCNPPLSWPRRPDITAHNGRHSNLLFFLEWTSEMPLADGTLPFYCVPKGCCVSAKERFCYIRVSLCVYTCVFRILSPAIFSFSFFSFFHGGLQLPVTLSLVQPSFKASVYQRRVRQYDDIAGHVTRQGQGVGEK